MNCRCCWDDFGMVLFGVAWGNVLIIMITYCLYVFSVFNDFQLCYEIVNIVYVV